MHAGVDSRLRGVSKRIERARFIDELDLHCVWIGLDRDLRAVPAYSIPVIDHVRRQFVQRQLHMKSSCSAPNSVNARSISSSASRLDPRSRLSRFDIAA